jgi:hypothetical protein
MVRLCVGIGQKAFAHDFSVIGILRQSINGDTSAEVFARVETGIGISSTGDYS